MREFLNKIFGREEEKAPGDEKSLEEFLKKRDIKRPKRETVEYAYDHTKKPSPPPEPKTIHFTGFDKYPNSESSDTRQEHKKPGGSGDKKGPIGEGSPPDFPHHPQTPKQDLVWGPDDTVERMR